MKPMRGKQVAGKVVAMKPIPRRHVGDGKKARRMGTRKGDPQEGRGHETNTEETRGGWEESKEDGDQEGGPTREEELLSIWWKEYAECSEGPKERAGSSLRPDKQKNESASEVAKLVNLYDIEEERVGVPVKGGLYEVNLV
ncbi:phospholipase SGR2 [Cucumis melo var. makuwa]|uniref:Phospholipase SGR2 n=1 Tax=Cucumis melo var. makuwa TaxID=1194695 RepID=A0A5D3C5E9_CUCMM|nr:phospholipase SGR2 [Cucumis melo var. makuwa]